MALSKDKKEVGSTRRTKSEVVVFFFFLLPHKNVHNALKHTCLHTQRGRDRDRKNENEEDRPRHNRLHVISNNRNMSFIFFLWCFKTRCCYIVYAYLKFVLILLLPCLRARILGELYIICYYRLYYTSDSMPAPLVELYSHDFLKMLTLCLIMWGRSWGCVHVNASAHGSQRCWSWRYILFSAA